METNSQIKEMVKQKYGLIATQTISQNLNSCCGSGSCSTVDYSIISDDYSKIEGYFAEADLGLGCGLPTEFAGIEVGNTVLDLGSGAGNDAFIVRRLVGSTGKVLGIDMTDEMIEKSRKNCLSLGYNNVEFRYGDIEKMPVESDSIDVVISNCVLNLVPDKSKAFSEIYRTLRPGAHFCISDIVIIGELPDRIRKSAEMYAGCIGGAMEKDDYIGLLAEVGFKNFNINREKEIIIPEDIMENYLNEDEILLYKNTGAKILSMTISGVKPE
ncbi:MAG: arsenite methyltransferase [Candidatus Kapabacteria bacterium]|nr:arsenite methyltransferase [Candidatus Kapabacteria bacterium]